MTSDLMFYILSEYFVKLDNYRKDISFYKSSNLYVMNKDFRHLVSLYESNYKDMCFLVDKFSELALLKEKEEKINESLW